MKRKQIISGFTFIELAAIVAVFAILLLVILPAASNSTKEKAAKESTEKAVVTEQVTNGKM